MRRIVGVGSLAIALIALCSSAAVAQVAPDGIGALDQYRTNGETARHLEEIFTQPPLQACPCL